MLNKKENKGRIQGRKQKKGQKAEITVQRTNESFLAN